MECYCLIEQIKIKIQPFFLLEKPFSHESLLKPLESTIFRLRAHSNLNPRQLSAEDNTLNIWIPDLSGIQMVTFSWEPDIRKPNHSNTGHILLFSYGFVMVPLRWTVLYKRNLCIYNGLAYKNFWIGQLFENRTNWLFFVSHGYSHLKFGLVFK